MKRKAIIALAAMATLSLGELPLTNVAQAAGMFDMMNPSRWFGGNRNRDRDYYGDRGYGYGPYGYGGPWGGYGGPYGGYGGPWGGYGYGRPYGYGGWGGHPGGYGPGSTIVVNPPSNTGRDTRGSAPRLPE